MVCDVVRKIRISLSAIFERGEQEEMPDRLLPFLELTADSVNALADRASRVRAYAKYLWEQEEGKDTVEYGLLVALLSLAGIIALVTLGRALGLLGASPSGATGQHTH